MNGIITMKKHVKFEHSKLAYKFVEKPINVETSQLNIQWLAKKKSTIIGHNSISFFPPMDPFKKGHEQQ